MQEFEKLHQTEAHRQLKLLVDRQPGREPMKLWEAIIAYANDDSHGEVSIRDDGFPLMLAESFGWIGGGLEDLALCHDVQGKDKLAFVASGVLQERYRPEIKRVLTYLAAPELHSNLAIQAAEFLKHGTRITMHVGSSGFDPEEGLLISEYWPEWIGSVISPVCKFILDQIERHDEGREPLRKVIPIGLCDRPGCGKFRIIKKQRKGKVFCSTLCRANFSQANKSKESKAAYMREHRATVKRATKKKGKKK